MDFNPGMLHSFPGNVPLPFYMAYPGYMSADFEQSFMRDLEYLQQTYPAEVKTYQRKVAEVLDKLDYEGSMIYDEYPDKYRLQQLAQTIAEMMNKAGDSTKEPVTDKKDFTYLLQVLICDEIYKRKNGRNRLDVWNIQRNR